MYPMYHPMQKIFKGLKSVYHSGTRSMNNDILEQHYSNIFTLPKARFTLALGMVSIVFASILYGTARAFFATRYLLLALTFVILVFLMGQFIHLAFNGRRIFFLAFLMLIFVEIFDFIVFHLGFPYLISLTPAIISSFLTIILYFSSEADEGTVCSVSFSMILLIYPLNYLFSFDAPSRFHIVALTASYVVLAFLGTVTGYLYIKFLDRDMGFNVKEFLRAFLLFWLTSNPRYLEEKLESVQTPHRGWIRCLSVGKAHLIAHAFHAGPFRNIGGATLVKRILSMENAVYLHSATNHDKNLATRREVERLVQSVSCSGENIAAMKPYQVSNERFTVTVFPFERFRLMVVSGNEVIDDLSSEIQEFADAFGDVLVVDAHNAHRKGYEVTREDINTLKLLVEKAARIESEKSVLSCSFTKKQVHAANICDYLALLLLDYGDVKYALFMIDSNNIRKGFRLKIERFLREKGFQPVVISTDNHLKTGLPPKLEYYPAGEDKSDHQAVFSFLQSVDFARMEDTGTVTYTKREVELNVIGNAFLENLERATVKLGKKGIYVFILVLALQLVAAVGLTVFAI